MRKILKWLLAVLVLGTAIWYFGIKGEHYRISFSTKHPPGIVYDQILDGASFQSDEIDSIQLLEKIAYSEIQQNVYINDSLFQYKWTIEKESDDKTRATAYITDLKNNWMQKFQVPFGRNDFVARNTSHVSALTDALQLNAKQYRVHSLKDTLIGGTHCVYLPIESRVKAKAKNMLAHIATIMEYINSNEIELQGDPFLEVTRWDQDNETMAFNFCFPINPSDSIPKNKELKFKTVKPFRALKAEFNGNYRISNMAWYHLLDKAKTDRVDVVPLPFEIYLDDPHVGGDPLNWKALILLPITEE